MESSKAQAVCALCSASLVEAGNSEEHIIPNSIGGRRKIYGFICRNCNSQTGQNWDAEIWRQLANVAMMHGVARERGVAPSIPIQTVDGSRYLLRADGTMTIEHPTYAATPAENGMSIKVSARDLKEARRMAKDIAKKYPKVDLQDILGKMATSETPLASPITFTSMFGGNSACRSITKSAVAMAVASGVVANDCDTALAFLRSDAAPAPHGFFYLRDLISSRPDSHAINCVAVRGDPARGLLLAYVEYFSICRMVIILSDSYKGAPVAAAYAFNPANGAPLTLQIDLDLSDNELDLVRKNEAQTDASYRAALDSGFATIYKRSRMQHWDREFEDAFHKTMKEMNIQWGDVIPRERAIEFSALMVKHLGPTISQLVRR